MKLIGLPKQQIVIEGNVKIPREITTLVGYRHQGNPIAQGKVLGDFDCSFTQIKSLVGGPSWVGGGFYCRYTNIISLEQGPSWVGGDFNCVETKIKSLEGGPNYVGGNFNCYYTNITSVEQGPGWVGGYFNCVETKIKSLHDIHKEIKHIGCRLLIPDTVTSHILGVMFIKGLLEIEIQNDNIEQKQVERIINKHLAGDRNVHLAQEELLEGGLAEFAKL